MIHHNPIYAGLFGDAGIEALFTPEAEIAAMIRVEAALARAQGRLGLIPAEAAAAIEAGLATASVDAHVLASGTAEAGVPVPKLVAELRRQLPEDAAHWVHWGATSQDILDCALVLRVTAALAGVRERLAGPIEALADMAEAHVATPMAGRTRTQIATPISFGLRVAYWLQGLLDVRDTLPAVEDACGRVQFGGASGANSATAPHGQAIIPALAEALDLAAAPPWHTSRAMIPGVLGWCAAGAGAASRIAGDVLILARREVGELRLTRGGGSSTMPNKANPVPAEAVVALARYLATLVPGGHLAMAHAEDRDSTAWMLEWLTVPQALIGAGAALRNLDLTLRAIEPDPEAMARNLALDGGAAMAEAASFALAAHLPRAEAQGVVKAAANAARTSGRSMVEELEVATAIDGLADEIERLARLGSGAEIVAGIVERARQG